MQRFRASLSLPLVAAGVWLLANAPVRAESPVVGTTQPIRQLDLSFPESGVISELGVREGEEVSRGQVLARLDTQIQEAALRIARIRAGSTAAVQSAEAHWKLSRRRLEELEKLAKTGSANRQEVERARVDLEVAAAELDAAREESATQSIQVEQILAQIERRTLRSPVDGVVERIHREVAENVDPARGPLMTVVKLDRLHLLAHVDAGLAEGLHRGLPVPVRTIDGSLQDEAEVDFVSPVIDPASGTRRVKLVLDNRDGRHRSGRKYLLDLEGAASAPAGFAGKASSR